MRRSQTVIIGAGMGGLAAAIVLASKGERVTLVERADAPGGKMRRVMVGDAAIDGGPTVFTMRHVFDEILSHAGTQLEDHITLEPADVIARHAWLDGSNLDLFADIERSADAIGVFAGAGAARQYRRFCADSQAMFRTLDRSFMRQSTPSMAALFKGASVGALSRTRPFQSLWTSLARYFSDPRLRQLFARYSTYVGSSPFLAPGTLMLIAHVEQAGVWRIKGGMHELAKALADVARNTGASLRFGSHVKSIDIAAGHISGVTLESGERLKANRVIFNGDINALASGLLGDAVRPGNRPLPAPQRSLSALTWAMNVSTSGFGLDHHNVFFSNDYRDEFDQLFKRRQLPTEPTIYICAQDRGTGAAIDGAERLLCLVNAPARGDDSDFSVEEINACETATFAQLTRYGLTIDRSNKNQIARTSPKEFHQLFPATGGALYGQASHGWRASFTRPGQRTTIPGLYLAGGSVHPGAGVPMAALSGLTAAASLIADSASTLRSGRAVMSGGISTA